MKKIALNVSLLALLQTAPLHAEIITDSEVSEQDKVWMDEMMEIADETGKQLDFDPRPEAVTPAQAKDIAEASGTEIDSDKFSAMFETNEANPSADGESYKHGKYEAVYAIAISEALGTNAIEQIALNSAACMAREPVAIKLMYRGIHADETITALQRRVASITKAIVDKGFETGPKVNLDPKLFAKTTPEAVVPTIAKIAERNGSWYPLTTIAGITSVCDWHQNPNMKPPLQPQVVVASEIDMIELIHAKAKEVDWDNLKEQARKRAYGHLKSHHLPAATKDHADELDMRIRVTADIKDHEGNIIAPKGMLANPMQNILLTQTLFTVNPNRAVELEWLMSALEKDFNPIVMFSETPRAAVEDLPAKFWELEQQIGHPIYMLQKPIKERFHIEQTPAVVVQSSETHMRREYIALKDHAKND